MINNIRDSTSILKSLFDFAAQLKFILGGIAQYTFDLLGQVANIAKEVIKFLVPWAVSVASEMLCGFVLAATGVITLGTTTPIAITAAAGCLALGSASFVFTEKLIIMAFGEQVDFGNIGPEILENYFYSVLFIGVASVIAGGTKYVFTRLGRNVSGKLWRATEVCAAPDGGIRYEDLPDGAKNAPRGITYPGEYNLTPGKYSDYPDLIKNYPDGIKIQFDAKGYPSFSKLAINLETVKPF